LHGDFLPSVCLPFFAGLAMQLARTRSRVACIPMKAHLWWYA